MGGNIIEFSGGQPMQDQPQAKLDLSTADTVQCASCGGTFFQSVIFFKRISALISPTGQESLVPIDTFSCIECGNINQEFLPRGVNPGVTT